MSVVLARFIPCEHVPKPAIDALPDACGQPVEGRGVDQVAAGVLEQPRRQVEVAERAAVPVARAGPRELLGKTARPLDRIGELYLVAKEKVLDELLRGRVHAPEDALRQPPLGR